MKEGLFLFPTVWCHTTVASASPQVLSSSDNLSELLLCLHAVMAIYNTQCSHPVQGLRINFIQLMLEMYYGLLGV